jgi:hypothetical protein
MTSDFSRYKRISMPYSLKNRYFCINLVLRVYKCTGNKEAHPVIDKEIHVTEIH